MPRDGAGDFIQIQAQPLGFHHQLFHLFLQQRAALGRGGSGELSHHRSQAGTHFDQAFCDELRHNFVRRVGINLQGFAQSADRGERVARPHLARDHGLFRGVDYLFVERNARLEREAERDHRCTITDNTAQSRRIMT